ncbi:hypothetical protein GLYMA_01G117401v4 [Glycine max]|nr:hypothetical protein GLYMA_01G117401v4 [Glycine max]KAH1162697.1 hypothetical protein GYH30_001268 [Glycine max]
MCGNINWAKRTKCNICNTNKPGHNEGGVRHVAVVSLLLSSLVPKLVDPAVDPDAYRNVVSTVTLFAGIFQAAFGIFRRNHHDWFFIQECSPGGLFFFNKQCKNL